jgi:hypothetical protein
VWNNLSFCELLEETFPEKDMNFKDSGCSDFHFRIAQIEPEFSFDDSTKWIDFVRKVKILVDQYGKANISAKDEQLAVETFKRNWSKQIQANFNAFVGIEAVKILNQFMKQVLKWTYVAKAAKAQVETVDFLVISSKVTHHSGSNSKGPNGGFREVNSWQI